MNTCSSRTCPDSVRGAARLRRPAQALAGRGCSSSPGCAKVSRQTRSAGQTCVGLSAESDRCFSSSVQPVTPLSASAFIGLVPCFPPPSNAAGATHQSAYYRRSARQRRFAPDVSPVNVKSFPSEGESDMKLNERLIALWWQAAVTS